jgi:Fur family ferric uptake transcriptional regulator
MSPHKLQEKILVYMANNGLRITSQRKAIIQAAFSTNDHYTAEELLERSRKLDSSVSRATVYRTLPVLVDSGLLRELDLGKDFKYYDPNYVNHPNHNHIVCTDCEKIVEFEDHCLDVRESVLATSLGFKPKAVRLRIEAACVELAKKGACVRSGKKSATCETASTS